MPTATLTIRDLMTPDVVTISMDDTLRGAQQTFAKRRFHHLIVTDGGRAVGVISDRDLLKHLSPFVGVRFSERAQDTETLRKRIHQIMTRKLVSVLPDASPAEAARLLLTHRVSCLPVIDGSGILMGILTSRDLIRWLVMDRESPFTPGPPGL